MSIGTNTAIQLHGVAVNGDRDKPRDVAKSVSVGPSEYILEGRTIVGWKSTADEMEKRVVRYSHDLRRLEEDNLRMAKIIKALDDADIYVCHENGLLNRIAPAVVLQHIKQLLGGS